MDFVDIAIHDGTTTDARLWEIAENLHRAELSALERDEHVAEWVRLTGERDAAQVAPHRKAGQQPGGINAAVRDLGIERTAAQRAVKVAALTDDAKAAAREMGLADNRTALLAATRVAPEAQAEAIRNYKPAPRAEAPPPPPRPAPAIAPPDRYATSTNSLRFASSGIRGGVV